MTAEQLLLQLKDIEPPPEPAWWLVAPAHLVIVGVIAAVLAGGWLLLRLRRAGRLAKLAEHEFEQIKSDYQRDRYWRIRHGSWKASVGKPGSISSIKASAIGNSVTVTAGCSAVRFTQAISIRTAPKFWPCVNVGCGL